METYSVGAQYRDVKIGYLSPLTYSKTSAAFLFVIAIISAFNIFLLMTQVSSSFLFFGCINEWRLGGLKGFLENTVSGISTFK